MMITLFFIIMTIWLMGLMTAHMLGTLIHLFLVLALIVLVVEFLERRKPL
jgi:hypothetical protein